MDAGATSPRDAGPSGGGRISGGCGCAARRADATAYSIALTVSLGWLGLARRRRRRA
jgi:hypothetical protein